MKDCTHRTIKANRCTSCGEHVRIDPLPPPIPFCSICGAEGEGVVLVLVDDGKRKECTACREEHPRSGRYGFSEADHREVRQTGVRTHTQGGKTLWSTK